ncbi:MAG: AraC family transcriptional regulator [Clostridia bacterium]|nr:AraC family transcriptional regulator [Clostridia bacterium]
MLVENVGRNKACPKVDDLGFSSDEFLTISVCGYYHVSEVNNRSERVNGRKDYNLLYVMQGRILIATENGEEWVPEGNVVLYRPGEYQKYLYFAEDEPAIYWMHFSGYGVSAILKNMGFAEGHVFYTGKSDSICSIMRQLIGELQVSRENCEMYCRGYFLQLIALISERIHSQNEEISAVRYKELRTVVEHINHRYYDDTDIEEYAHMCHMSKYHFIRIFKEYVGMTPHKYKSKIRMDRAKNLLKNTSMSIHEVGEMVGFTDTAQFSKQFKIYTGKTPNSFRNEAGN